ncbi:hypothetical protein ACFWIQ_08565 [Kitasatospora sp. NPDC127059]|uniref:hypothetical protein n=1 Tax=unclassified Kitasatospora TaxID=2633591 RepID=UPI00364C18D2
MTHRIAAGRPDPAVAVTERRPVVKGDVLCTVASKGNLAVPEITDVRQTGTPADPPASTGLVTLRKQPS